MKYINVKRKYLTNKEIELLTEEQQAEMITFTKQQVRRDHAYESRISESTNQQTFTRPAKTVADIHRELKRQGLSKEERKLISLWLRGYTQQEIGDRYNVTKQAISQRIAKTVKKIENKAKISQIFRELS